MRIAYLMNTYPMVSTTFITREMTALEDRGFEIERFVIRRWDGTLVDPIDVAEAAASDHLLEDGGARLFTGLFRELTRNPRGVFRALRLWWPLFRAGGGIVRHAAYLLEAVALHQRLRMRPVAHLHAHFSTNSAAVAMLTHALGGPSYSFTVHGPDEFFEPEKNSLGMKIAHAAFVACISHFCRSQCMIFAQVEAWDRLKIVHCGIRPGEFETAPPCPEDLPPKPPGGRVLYVARLSKLKGGLVLIDAMAALAGRQEDNDLVVIGDGEARVWMEEKARHAGILDRVHFLGFRDRNTVRAAMANADIITLPSFAEGVPVVLMEAMASRRPVVATQVAGVSELVTDGTTGFIVPPGDVTSLADRLDRLLGDADLRSRMGEAGADTVREAFDIDAEAASLGTLFNHAGQMTRTPHLDRSHK